MSSPPDERPDIPDRISKDQLQTELIRRGLTPVSHVLPVLTFGSGACDLHLVVSQIVERSTGGCSSIQMLVAAMHLLHETKDHLERRLAIARRGEPPFDDGKPHQRLHALQTLQRDLGDMENATAILARCLDGCMRTVSAIRAIEIHEHDPEATFSRSQLRSLILFSDEVLDCLQISRQAMAEFIDQLYPSP